MDLKEAVDNIVIIEQRYNINTLRYENLKIWPLIRLELWRRLFNPNMPTGKQPSQLNSNAPSSSILGRIRNDPLRVLKAPLRYLKNCQLHKEQIKPLQQKNPMDILFFSRVEDYSTQSERSFYNRHVDPMIDLVREEYSYSKVELYSMNGQATMPRVEPTIIVNPSFFWGNKLALKRFHCSQSDNSIKGFSEFQQVVQDVTGLVRLDEGNIIYLVNLIKQYQEFFEDMLSASRPKAVFLVCYYYAIAMALILACKKFGIITVDIQHGRQGKYHGLYTHWTKTPVEGYDLRPDYFWSWGEESKNNIERWQSEVSCHQPIVGGNRWLAKWINEDSSMFTTTADALPNKLQHSNNIKKIILVSLVPMDDPLPVHVLDAMRKSPDNWLWLIRLHPLYQYRKEQVCALIEQYGIHNFEIEYASRCPLYALIKHSDHHVTCFSSVCYEALAFNVPTTIVHQTGLQLYEDYINMGIFSYAQSCDELIAEIKRVYSKEQLKEPTPYIETSDQIAENAIKEIMRFQSVSSK